MKYKAPGKCPVCSKNLDITKLGCQNCGTTIEGVFEPCEFCNLPKEELNFLKVFIKCRGSIKDMEKELGISYPTVRGKLDNLIQMLGLDDKEKSTTDNDIDDFLDSIELQKQEILSAVEKGTLKVKEATEKIKNLYK